MCSLTSIIMMKMKEKVFVTFVMQLDVPRSVYFVVCVVFV